MTNYLKGLLFLWMSFTQISIIQLYTFSAVFCDSCFASKKEFSLLRLFVCESINRRS